MKIAKKFTKSDRYGMTFPLCASDPTNFAGTPILWANGVHIFRKDWRLVIGINLLGVCHDDSVQRVPILG